MTQPNIILVGLGGVGATVLEMLSLTELGANVFTNFQAVHIFDMDDKKTEPTLKMSTHFIFHKLKITQQNIQKFLNYIQPHDMVIDLSYNISFVPILEKCLSINAHYINTSVERWPTKHEEVLTTKNRLLKELHTQALEIGERGKEKGQICTSIITHGMNPGLISHFAYEGILNVAKRVLDKAKHFGKIVSSGNKLSLLKQAYKEKNFPLLAYILDIQVIHCSELDTQKPFQKYGKDVFVNTWGSYSFYSEGVDPVQLGWGTHETLKSPKKNQNEIVIEKRGIDMTCCSVVPLLEQKDTCVGINGMLISHSENDTLSKALTLEDINFPFYRPSVYYVYSPCQVAQKSIFCVKENGYKMLPKKKVLRATEIKSGKDSVGALLIFNSDPIQNIVYEKIIHAIPYWSGTILSIEQTKEMGLKYSGPTTVQVGASILAAISWILKNPKKGVLFPENVNYEEILRDASPYLGTLFSDFVDISISTKFEKLAS